MRENIVVAFSGGRTSAYMSWWLKENMSHIYNLHFVYANTGLEHEKTLEFVDKCDKYFNLNLTWVEAVLSMEIGIGTKYKIVNFENCTRDNTLFMELGQAYGLPNQKYIHCTRELKNIPMFKYAKEHIGKHRLALGIRYDEFHRVKLRKDAIFPLSTITKTTKKEIIEWWSNMPFDLEIEEHYGNCVGCYKKSDAKLKMIADENPHYFDNFIQMEEKFSSVKTKKELGDRKIYRHFRTANEVKNNLNMPNELTIIDECSDECGSMIMDSEKSELAYRSLFD